MVRSAEEMDFVEVAREWEEHKPQQGPCCSA